MLYLIITLLSLFSAMHAEVDPIPGENLWRLASQIGDCLDVTTSKVCVITSQLDIAISLSDELITSVDTLASVVDSLIDPLASQLDSVSDILSSQLIVLESVVESAIDLVSALEPLFPSIADVFESSLSTIDVQLSSITEVILSTIESVEETLSDQIMALSNCLLGTVISDVPYTITSEGVYTICEDLSLTTGTVPAIQISSGNVTLNMNNHTIFIGDAVNGIAINSAGAEGVINTIQVFNGTIQADNTLTVPCVQVYQAYQVELENIKTIGGANIHFLVSDNTADILIDRCQCLGNNGFLIDSLSGALDIAPPNLTTKNIIIKDCIIENPFNNGIRLGVTGGFGGTSAVSIINTEVLNVASDDAIGIYITSNASDVVCEECVVIGGVGATNIIGYQVESSSAILRWCTAQQNSNSGYYISLLSDASLFVECVAQGNGNGFSIYGDNAVLKRCSVTHNTNDGIYVDGAAQNTQILDTCPVNNVVDFIDLGTNTTFINLGTVAEILCSKIETAQEILATKIDNLDLDIVSVGDIILSVIDTLDDVPCLVGTIIRQADLVSGTYIIGVPGVYTVCEDLSGAFDLINIQSNNVVLNLNSHTLTSSSNRCIYSTGHSNIVIRNGSCTSANQAVYIDIGSSNILVENITIFNSAEPSIFCVQSEDITIRACTINDFNNNEILNGMIFISASNSVLIENCAVYGLTNQPVVAYFVQDPQAGGVVIRGCIAESIQVAGYSFNIFSTGSLDACIIEDCIASNITNEISSYGYGIFDLLTGTTGPTLIRCIAELSTNYGFYLDSSNGVILDECISRYNSIGYILFEQVGIFPVNNVLLNNCIAHTNSTGFRLLGLNTTLHMCKAINNTGTGFAILGNNTVLEKSLASRNISLGIDNSSGLGTFIVDTRSSNPLATALNPPYQLNGVADDFGTATVVIIS